MAPKKEDAKLKFLGARVSENTRNAFIEKSSRYGVPSDVLRELIDAFIENRLTIQAPVVTSNRKESLYVPRIEN